MGKKGKHIADHNNFIPGRSILTANPQEFIGSCVDKDTGDETTTEWGIIHSSKKGAHIVPALPDIT